MIMVIIAGGSGTRLWPLSTPDYPKHLLRFNDDPLSLLQHAYERAKRLSDSVYVVSEHSHIQYVKEQLKDLPDEAFITEPGRRGTANCIISALAHISKHQTTKEPIAFTHADHYIRDTGGFVQSFRTAERISAAEHRIVLVGVEADRPATIFGYIEKGKPLNEHATAYNVRSFKEKPDLETAKRYLASGNFVWNGGYFVGSMDTFLTSMDHFAPELAERYQLLLKADPNNYDQTYLNFEPEAIDYALIEKVNNLLVVPATFDWMDVGSFVDLANALDPDEQGNHIHGQPIQTEALSNSLVYSEEDKPIAVIGLDNVVVINTKNGLLVARKDVSQKVGDLSKRFIVPPAS